MKLSEEIMADVHAPNCHSVTDTAGRCTCYIGRWHDRASKLEAELEKLQYVTLPDGTVSNCFEAYIVWKRKTAQLEVEIETYKHEVSVLRQLLDDDGTLALETIEQQEGEIQALRDGIKIALDVINHGDFRNGNTGPNGIIDEGEVHAGRMVKRLTALLTGEDDDKL